ncbi:hypothetical protein LguiA_018747 [Lonicera macranthoides]
MRLSLLLSVLLLSTLFCEAQGIRLEKSSSLTRHDKIQESGDLTIKRSNGGGVGEVTLCRDGQCSGQNRKLMTKTTSTTTTTTTTSKNDQKTEGNKSSSEGVDGEVEKKLYVRSPPVSSHSKASPEHSPDILDIAGMDYSPAKRKPPIHN